MHRTQNLSVSAADTPDTTEVDVTPADTLRGAARYLEIRGWGRFFYYGGEPTEAFPPACALGAIAMAAHGRRIDTPQGQGPRVRDCKKAVSYFEDYLLGQGLTHPEGVERDADGSWILKPYSIGDWNDADERTRDEVSAALRAAADEYDRQHQIPAPADPTPAATETDDPLVDVGGYLPCGCHGSQREHSCGPRD